MNTGLSGQVALLTGPVTPLTVTAARHLGNAGVTLVFAGPQVAEDPRLRPILLQFRQCIHCIDVDLRTSEAVEETVAAVEQLLGRVDILLHTLGSAQTDAPEWKPAEGAALVWHGNTPLLGALTCSSGALRYMSRQNHGHVVHLVTRGDVGALEVEQLVQARLRQAWSQDGSPASVSMSAIYFEEIGPLLPASPAEEPRLLDTFVARLVEEEDWASRVVLERDIGQMVLEVCAQSYTDDPGTVHSFDFSGGGRIAPSLR
jgi:hypothetical protein